MQICKNIAQLKKKLGWSQTRIAEESGLNQASISRYISGKSEPKFTDAAKLARAFGVSMETLLTGEHGEEKFITGATENDEVHNLKAETEKEDYADEQYFSDSRLIPLIGWAHAGEAGNYEELPLDSQKRIPTECQDDQAFAVMLEGDSMKPKFSDGDMLVLMPNKRPYSGCLVVCRFANDGVIFRRMQIVADKIRLIPLNHDYSATEHSEDEFSWIYPVWGRWTQIWK